MTTTGFTRRMALALGLGAGLPMHAAPAAAADASLAALAQAAGLAFGASGSSELFRDADYRALFLAQAAVLVPEHELKFDALQPEQGRYNLGPADTIVDAGLAQGRIVRGHTLFWNDYPPAWLKTLTRGETQAVFERHLETVVPHFAGRLQSWDVVNEPFWLGRDRPGTFRPGPWFDAMGEDYIYRAFRRTAALDPSVRLVLNEAWTERTDPVGLAVRRALLALIDRIQDKGLKLDAIGLQGHLMPQEPYDDASFTAFLHEIAARKLDIYITELDVDDRSFPTAFAQRDQLVAARVLAFLTAALKVPAVKMVICWELADRYTWWRDPSVLKIYGLNRLPRPLPFDDQLRRKPMADAIATAFRERRV